MNKSISKLAIILSLLYFIDTYSQAAGVVGGNGYDGFQVVFTPRDEFDKTAEFKKISHKMYLSDTIYRASKVDKIEQNFFIRFNIYRDEMEFENNGKLLFLKKEQGRIVTFLYTNEKYELNNYDGKLTYFQVHNDDKVQLLSRKFIDFIEAKQAQNSYQQSRSADFRRKDDVFYLKSGNNITELPSKKSKFFDAFGNKSNEIKSYVKKNKLDIREIDGLKKIVNYLNTL